MIDENKQEDPSSLPGEKARRWHGEGSEGAQQVPWRGGAETRVWVTEPQWGGICTERKAQWVQSIPGPGR